MKNIGKYTILEELGTGGTGVVYRALDPVLEREVALKAQKVDAVRNEESILRFNREARLIARLEHPNIVTVFDLGQDSDQVYIVMELLRGEDLSSRLRSKKHMSLEQKLRIVIDVGRGLAHAHGKGIIHRDVKPQNVFLTERGEAKLLDFGLAHISQSTLTATGQLIGTPHYMSPEQVMGRRVDRRSDIFSLGSLLYELVTGEKPFVAPTLQRLFGLILDAEPAPIRDLAPAVTEELSRIVSKMMRKSPEERYRVVEDLLHDMSRVQRHVERRKSELRSEVQTRARKLRALLGRPSSASPEEGSREATTLLDTVERGNLSFMALVGLRDGLDIELWRVERDQNANVPSGDERRDVHPEAEAAFEGARARFVGGDLAGCLLQVSEVLRVYPEHGGAGELAEELRRSVVEHAARLEQEPALDVVVAAYLAFHEGGGAPTKANHPCQDAEAIASLSAFLLEELPVEPDRSSSRG